LTGRVYFDRQQDIAGRPALEREKKTLSKRKKKAAKETGREERRKEARDKKPEEKKSPKTAKNVASRGFEGAK